MLLKCIRHVSLENSLEVTFGGLSNRDIICAGWPSIQPRFPENLDHVASLGRSAVHWDGSEGWG